VATDGGRNIIGDEDCHASEWGCSGWVSGGETSSKSLKRAMRSDY
jgi:hypothetical protein